MSSKTSVDLLACIFQYLVLVRCNIHTSDFDWFVTLFDVQTTQYSMEQSFAWGTLEFYCHSTATVIYKAVHNLHFICECWSVNQGLFFTNSLNLFQKGSVLSKGAFKMIPFTHWLFWFINSDRIGILMLAEINSATFALKISKEV